MLAMRQIKDRGTSITRNIAVKEEPRGSSVARYDSDVNLKDESHAEEVKAESTDDTSAEHMAPQQTLHRKARKKQHRAMHKAGRDDMMSALFRAGTKTLSQSIKAAQADASCQLVFNAWANCKKKKPDSTRRTSLDEAEQQCLASVMTVQSLLLAEVLQQSLSRGSKHARAHSGNTAGTAQVINHIEWLPSNHPGKKIAILATLGTSNGGQVFT
jgi:hypothetical protein